jgi:tetratricopeptide (TPR) repeat protein
LWSSTYDRPASDLSGVQSDLTAAISRSLNAVAATPAANHVPKPEAHEYVIKARYEMSQLTPEAVAQSEADFQHAIHLDPEYAAAYYGLGLAKYNEYSARGSTYQTEAERQSGEQLMHRALALDPGMPEAHAMLARLAMQYDWDWDRAERELRIGVAGASSSFAEDIYAFLLAFRGRFPEADEHMRRAQDLDPFSIPSIVNFALLRSYEGRFQETRELLQKASAISPKTMSVRIGSSILDIEEGRTDLALQEIREWKAGFPAAPVIEAMAHARAGRRDEALRLLRPFEEKYPNTGAALQWFALTYAFLGDEPNTVKWLERSANRHEWQALNLAVHLAYAPMRNSPAFRALEKRMGLLP